VAAAVWAAQQPLDKRVFGTSYDDIELLGKAITRGPASTPAGLVFHLANGALFGAVYAELRPSEIGTPWTLGLAAALTENLAAWPLGGLVDRHHPARADIEPLAGNRRAFAAATWRHAIFGVVLGAVEVRLNTAADVG
jgi:hypothetical protein